MTSTQVDCVDVFLEHVVRKLEARGVAVVIAQEDGDRGRVTIGASYKGAAHSAVYRIVDSHYAWSANDAVKTRHDVVADLWRVLVARAEKARRK